MSNFFKNIKNLRVENNLTQKQLSEILNVSRYAVNRWERNLFEPTLDTLIKISHTFDISYEDLLL